MRGSFGNVLVVCTGNICRSPMGEHLWRLGVDGSGQVGSAGIAAPPDAPAAEHAVAAMAEKGCDLTAHRARRLEAGLARGCDLILVMEAGQQAWIERRFPELHGRVYRLGHWLGCDVPDPLGLPLEEFRGARDLIERAVASWVERLR